MGPPGGYGAALAAMAPKPPAPAGAMPALPSATGAPPMTGLGAQPTGAGSVPPKVAIGTAVQNLREVKQAYPESASEIDGWIAMLQSLANPAKPVTPSANPAPEGGDAAPA